MRFKLFVEMTKVIMPLDKGIEQIEDVIDNIFNEFKTTKERQEFINSFRGPRKIGEYNAEHPNFNNAAAPKKTKVSIFLTSLKRDNFLMMFKSNKIFINKKYIVDYKNIAELKNALLHEIIHVIQPFKKTSAKYKEMVTKGYLKKTYYTENIEVEAYMSQIVYDIQKTFYALSPAPYEIYGYRSIRQLFLFELEQWLKNENYNFSTIMQYTEALMYWKTNPAIMRNLKRKLYNTYTQLMQQTNRLPSGEPRRHYNINLNAIKQIRHSTKYKPMKYK